MGFTAVARDDYGEVVGETSLDMSRMPFLRDIMQRYGLVQAARGSNIMIKVKGRTR